MSMLEKSKYRRCEVYGNRMVTLENFIASWLLNYADKRGMSEKASSISRSLFLLDSVTMHDSKNHPIMRTCPLSRLFS